MGWWWSTTTSTRERLRQERGRVRGIRHSQPRSMAARPSAYDAASAAWVVQALSIGAMAAGDVAGMCGDRHQAGDDGSLRAGVACVLAFDCLLRVNELLALRVCDVVQAGDRRVGDRFDGMWLRLAKTKTGSNKSVQVRNPAVRALVMQLLRYAHSSHKLFPYSASTFRSHFKRAAADIGVSKDVVVHSLRHGGATHLFTEEKMAIAEIAEHGRWASVESARHYLQACRALLMARAAERVVDVGRRLAADLVASFALAQKHS